MIRSSHEKSCASETFQVLSCVNCHLELSGGLTSFWQEMVPLKCKLTGRRNCRTWGYLNSKTERISKSDAAFLKNKIESRRKKEQTEKHTELIWPKRQSNCVSINLNDSLFYNLQRKWWRNLKVMKIQYIFPSILSRVSPYSPSFHFFSLDLTLSFFFFHLITYCKEIPVLLYIYSFYMLFCLGRGGVSINIKVCPQIR